MLKGFAQSIRIVAIVAIQTVYGVPDSHCSKVRQPHNREEEFKISTRNFFLLHNKTR